MIKQMVRLWKRNTTFDNISKDRIPQLLVNGMPPPIKLRFTKKMFYEISSRIKLVFLKFP